MLKNLMLAALAAAALIQPALAADTPVVLRTSIWLPPAHPLVPTTKAWSDDMEKESGGSVKLQIYPSEQLGKAFDHYDMARDGIADITYVNPGYQPGRFPIISIGQIPFTFKDARTGTAALDSWYRKYAATEMKDVHFCFAFMHSPGIYMGRKPVVAPADIKGLKIRPPQSTFAQLVTSLGGTNVQASAPETRDVIERGVADGLFFPAGSGLLFGLDKVTKYYTVTPIYTTIFVYVMNTDKYDSLAPDQKKVIDGHCSTDWAVKIAGQWADFEDAGLVKLKAEPGKEITDLTPAQIDEWKKASEPLHKAWAESVKKAGGNPDEADKEFQAALATYKAGY
jgi:TRAP-type C4-dicarboxylate transport system substrate-binding protein